MRLLFVDSGALGFHFRYAYDIYTTLQNDFDLAVHHVPPHELTISLIRNFKPDMLLVVHGTATPLHIIRDAGRLGVLTVLWLVEDPYEIDLHRGYMVKSYDFVFTNEKQAVKEYRDCRAFYLPWCCNPRIHKRMAVAEEYKSDLCFIGMGFANRIRILNTIAPLLKNLKLKLIGDWRNWGAELHPSLQKYVIPIVNDPREVQKFYNGAKINLNIHRDPVDPPSGNTRRVHATSPNDRAFALAGCGAFQIVDHTRPDLWECFTEGQSMVSFSSAEDLGRKIEESLAKPHERDIIGNMAQQTVYSQHTFKHRLAEILNKVNNLKGWKTRTVSQNSPVLSSKTVSHFHQTTFSNQK